MSANPTGGHAFPTGKGVLVDDFPGMTLRDYFAAKAMQAGFAHMLQAGVDNQNGNIAKAAYEIADHMIYRRDQP